MGASRADRSICRWMNTVGDPVDRDEPLFEISTDKVDAEIPSPAAGTLTEVRFKEGETVEVNTVVAVLDGDGTKPAATAEVTAAAEPSAPAETPVEAEPEKSEKPTPAPEPKVEAPAAVERPKPIVTTEE